MIGLSTITAAVLAGGLGTRLRSVTGDRAKVLAEIAGRPFLAYLLDQLSAVGIRRVVLCTGYRSDQVEAAFGARYGSLALEYSREPAPLGTGGALRLALSRLSSSMVLVANGDSYCDADLKAFWRWHNSSNARGSLLLAKVPDTSRFGRVSTDDGGQITHFAEKRSPASPGWINAGLYLLERDILAQIPTGIMTSLESQVFPRLIGQGLYGFKAAGSFIDIGTPESFAQATAFFAAKKPAAATLSGWKA
jgi:D-glycero-alpha-D-manno-heptose 1-phosphate guanylyltransferase